MHQRQQETARERERVGQGVEGRKGREGHHELFPNMNPYVCPYVCSSVCPYVYPSVCPYVCPYMSPYMCAYRVR